MGLRLFRTLLKLKVNRSHFKHFHGSVSCSCTDNATLGPNPIPRGDNIGTTLHRNYTLAKELAKARPLPLDIDPHGIFCNNELDLSEIDVYGFDYDYTLANYTSALGPLIYTRAKEQLVKDYKYPSCLLETVYNPDFAIRGLHCAVDKGLLMKIDSYHNIQLGTVYRGHTPVSDSEVLNLFKGAHVAIDQMSNFYGKMSQVSRMIQLMDQFTIPQVTLFADIVEYFVDNEITHSPENLFFDVANVVNGLHTSGILHDEIGKNIAMYLKEKNYVNDVLARLQHAGKQVFLITNSSFAFVDKGMQYLVGKDWRHYFHVIITNARKPKFFNRNVLPFREFDTISQQKRWTPVTEFRKGAVYQEGNVHELSRLTGWYGQRVLYFGDHVYADLADLTLKHGWRTGAIIPELENEIRKINTEAFKDAVQWRSMLEELIQEMQVYEEPEAQQVVMSWLRERHQLRLTSKTIFNPQFGSIFRTYSNPTYFSRRLNRFSDLYTSSVVNLLEYSLKHTFYPRRNALPHEPVF